MECRFCGIKIKSTKRVFHESQCEREVLHDFNFLLYVRCNWNMFSALKQFVQVKGHLNLVVTTLIAEVDKRKELTVKMLQNDDNEADKIDSKTIDELYKEELKFLFVAISNVIEIKKTNRCKMTEIELKYIENYTKKLVCVNLFNICKLCLLPVQRIFKHYFSEPCKVLITHIFNLSIPMRNQYIKDLIKDYLDDSKIPSNPLLFIDKIDLSTDIIPKLNRVYSHIIALHNKYQQHINSITLI